MKKTLCTLIVSLIILFSLPSRAVVYKNDVHYRTLPTNIAVVSSQKTISEIFWYGCPHCYKVEFFLAKWMKKNKKILKGVKFEKIPATGNKYWDNHAQFFYAAESMGILDKVHMKLFNAIHGDKKNIYDEKKLSNFVQNQNINVKASYFSSIFNSFGVLTKVNNNKILLEKYNLTGVPAFVVNGKYITSPSQASGVEEMFKLIKFLLKK